MAAVTEARVTAERRPVWLEAVRAAQRVTSFAARGALRHNQAVPRLAPVPTTLATVFVDEVLMTAARVRMGSKDVDLASLLEDVATAVSVLGAAGCVDDPLRLHPVPVAPGDVRLTSRRVFGLRFEHLSFPSCYEPLPGLPRRDEWLADEGNHRAHAYVVRHDDRPRPWVAVLHGHRQGEPMDLVLMGAAALSRRLGVNVVHPVLPLHGPRSRTSGYDPFPSIDPLVNFYGLSQAMWDVRQTLAWARAEGARDIGVHGVSLGGHAAALLASVDPSLACVIAGVPTADLSTMLAGHAARFDGDAVVAAAGMLDPDVRSVNHLVSPLAYTPLLEKSRLFIYAGVGDRITTPEQAVSLWRHWGEPAIHWVQRGHIGTSAAKSAKRFIVDALRANGVAA